MVPIHHRLGISSRFVEFGNPLGLGRSRSTDLGWRIKLKFGDLATVGSGMIPEACCLGVEAEVALRVC